MASDSTVKLPQYDSSAQRLNILQLLLPPNYDIKNIPPDFLQAVAAGEVPDFSKIPADLKILYLTNIKKLLSEVIKVILQLKNYD